MKDAHGHGSNGGSTTFKTAGLKGVGLSANFSAPSMMKSGRDFKTDADRTVYDLRQRMAGAGAGESHGLMQGIRNFLGG
jgi:hypothetical protein